MHKHTFGAVAALALYFFAGSVYADSIVEVWSCKVNDGKSGDEIVKASADWLKAAQGMPGGKDLEVYVEFSLVSQSGGDSFNFVLVTPDIKTWGLFNQDYEGSAAAKADEAWNRVATCSGNTLWESVQVE